MKIKCIETPVPLRNTSINKYMPAYEVALVRELIRFKNPLEIDRVRISTPPIPKSRDGKDLEPIHVDVTLRSEEKRLKNTYRELFARAYPTSAAFEEAFVATAEKYALDYNEKNTDTLAVKRDPLPIDVIEGVSPTYADEIAKVLGDGELETLANADVFVLNGVHNVGFEETKRVIAAARELCGFKDELTLAEEVEKLDAPATYTISNFGVVNPATDEDNEDNEDDEEKDDKPQKPKSNLIL